MKKITAVWESPTNEGTISLRVGYESPWDNRTKGLGKVLAIVGGEYPDGHFVLVMFEHGEVFLPSACCGTRVEEVLGEPPTGDET